MKFHMPTEILFGSGTISRLHEIIEKDLGSSTPLLITDKGIMHSEIAEKVLSQGDFHVFDDVEPNPRSTTVNTAGEMARSLAPDLVVGLGGGSSLDTAKAAALLATNDGTIGRYEGKGRYKNSPLPVLAIPTTCGTGSEVTWVSVITDTTRMLKMSIKGPELFPTVAIIDPDLLVSLPQSLIASTGMDALTHAIEAYTVRPRTVITGIFALQAIRLIVPAIECAYENIKDDREAREGMMLGSTLAGVAFGNSDVGAVHCIAETVGGLYDIPHGIANSIFLPYVMEFNIPAAKKRYAKISRMLGSEERSDNAAARELIQRVKDLSAILQIPSFRDLGIKKSEFPEIARRSVQNNSNSSNPREISVEGYLEILTRASEI